MEVKAIIDYMTAHASSVIYEFLSRHRGLKKTGYINDITGCLDFMYYVWILYLVSFKSMNSLKLIITVE